MNLVTVFFPGGPVVRAELAVRPDEIQHGLMGRAHVPEGTGMLFDMGQVSDHRFWMRNTWVPLDMIFLDPSGVVVGIVHETVPFDMTLRGVETPSRYVLEVPGGWSRRHKVQVGQRVEIVSGPR